MDGMNIRETIEQLEILNNALAAVFGLTEVSDIIYSAKLKCEGLDKVCDALAEVKQRHEEKYNYMNKDYWDGARFVIDTIAKHLEIEEVKK